jgi:uncharacterized protein involved in response to NO
MTEERTVMPSPGPEVSKIREMSLQRVLTVWIVSGLVFMLLPGTFLGVWNLVAIAGEHTAAEIDPAWIQAHGHAQIFGWIGTFILGIGFYSLSKMGGLPGFTIARAWTSWALWTAGVALRWATNLWLWHWRWMLPFSALLELFAFALFFGTIRHHRPRQDSGGGRPAWMTLVMAGAIGFFASLLAILLLAAQSAVAGAGPAIPHDVDQRLLVLFTWAFPVFTIWGFSARWLPVFLGTGGVSGRMLLSALAAGIAGIAAAMAGLYVPATIGLLAAAGLSLAALRILRRPVKPPKITGVHSTFPLFVRLAYGWLVIAASISLAAALWDRAGGLWGSSRHALTVGFIAAMVFAIGQRVLPAFCGMRVLYSPKLMFWAAALLNLGCLLRVASEIGAYESYAPAMWPLLPVSAVLEMTAVTLFAVNLLLTFRQPPAHLAGLD